MGEECAVFGQLQARNPALCPAIGTRTYSLLLCRSISRRSRCSSKYSKYFQGALCKSLDNVHLFLCSSKDFRHLEFADSVSVLLSVSLLITILFASIIHQCVKLLQIEIHHGIYLHSLLWYSCNHSDALCACCSHPPPPPASSRAAGPCRGFGGLLDKELSM